MSQALALLVSVVYALGFVTAALLGDGGGR